MIEKLLYKTELSEQPSNKNTVEFKSYPVNYVKEISGIKSNIVRFTDDWTKTRWKHYLNAEYVKITNSETKEFFIRQIKDKTTYKNLVIISW